MSKVVEISAFHTAQRAVITNGANENEPVWIIHGPRENGVQENTAVFANSEYLVDRALFNQLESGYQKSIPKTAGV